MLGILVVSAWSEVFAFAFIVRDYQSSRPGRINRLRKRLRRMTTAGFHLPSLTTMKMQRLEK